MKRLLYLYAGTVVIVLIAGFLWLFVERKRETFRDANVIAGVLASSMDVFLVHHSVPQYLVVKGITYKKVRGLPPYYLNFPQSGRICFVTERSGDQITIHIVNLRDGSHVAIDTGMSGFGWGIGGDANANSFPDEVKSETENSVSLLEHSQPSDEIYTLDLVSKTLVRTVVHRNKSVGPKK